LWNIPGTAKGVTLEPSEHVVGYFELNQNILVASKIAKKEYLQYLRNG
jgi:hypothetical protein